MLTEFNQCEWEHSKQKAELKWDKVSLIEMEFNRKVTNVKIGKKKLELRKDGFWCPKIMITEKDKVIALQKQIGIWGTNSQFVVEQKEYLAKTKQGALFNITYSNSDVDILTYKLDAAKNRPKITFEIKSFDIPEDHLFILLALGFYSIKNVAIEAMSNDFIVTAVA